VFFAFNQEHYRPLPCCPKAGQREIERLLQTKITLSLYLAALVTGILKQSTQFRSYLLDVNPHSRIPVPLPVPLKSGHPAFLGGIEVFQACIIESIPSAHAPRIMVIIIYGFTLP
jgi:hypothetical protein